MTKRRYEKDGAIWRIMFDVNADIAMMESEISNPVPSLDEEFPIKNLRREGRLDEKKIARKRKIAIREAKKVEKTLRETAKKDGKKLDTVYVDGFVIKRKWR